MAFNESEDGSSHAHQLSEITLESHSPLDIFKPAILRSLTKHTRTNAFAITKFKYVVAS